MAPTTSCNDVTKAVIGNTSALETIGAAPLETVLIFSTSCSPNLAEMRATHSAIWMGVEMVLLGNRITVQTGESPPV